MAATPLPDGEARLLGYVLTEGVRGGAAAIWTAVVDAEGVVRDRVVVDQVDQTLTEEFCFAAQTYWSIDAVGSDALIRYVGFYGDSHHRVTARIDAEGQFLWQRNRPGGTPASGQQAADPDSVEIITSTAPTADGGAIVAGFRFHRPAHENAGFIARLDRDGTELWRRERPGSLEGGIWPVFGSAVETPDGAVLAVAAEDRRRAAARSLTIDADGGGETP